MPGRVRGASTTLLCSACEPLLSAQLQAVKDDLKAHLDQQLEELTNRLRSEYEIDKQASSNFRLTASLLKRPFASAANATSERIAFPNANIEYVTER